MDEALAEEGDIEDGAVTENVERCQEVLIKYLVKNLRNERKTQFWRRNR